MNAARTWAAISWLPDGRLFVVGGLDDDRQPLATVEMLQCSWDTEVTPQGNWQRMAPLNHARAAHGLAFISGRLVAAGGKRVESVEYFKLPSDDDPLGQWTVIRQMHRALCLCGLVPFQGGLLGVGKGVVTSVIHL